MNAQDTRLGALVELRSAAFAATMLTVLFALLAGSAFAAQPAYASDTAHATQVCSDIAAADPDNESEDCEVGDDLWHDDEEEVNDGLNDEDQINGELDFDDKEQVGDELTLDDEGCDDETDEQLSSYGETLGVIEICPADDFVETIDVVPAIERSADDEPAIEEEDDDAWLDDYEEPGDLEDADALAEEAAFTSAESEIAPAEAIASTKAGLQAASESTPATPTNTATTPQQPDAALIVRKALAA